jgi:hypothetical protein
MFLYSLRFNLAVVGELGAVSELIATGTEGIETITPDSLAFDAHREGVRLSPKPCASWG